MIDLSNSLCLGKITKTHGIKGQVLLRLDQFGFDDILRMEPVFIEIDGLPVPFFIEQYKEKTTDTLILSFDDINSEEDAAELAGCKLFIDKNNIRLSNHINNIRQLSDLRGYTVIDKEAGKLGKLKDVLDIEMNPLLSIMNRKKEILLPFQPEFIVSVDTKNKIIYTHSPSGLSDIF